MTPFTTEAFEAKYQRSADDPASAEMFAVWEAAWNTATERAAKKEREEILQLALTRTAMLPSDSDYTRGYALAKNDFAAAIRAREGKGATDV